MTYNITINKTIDLSLLFVCVFNGKHVFIFIVVLNAEELIIDVFI